jgi:predicted esterase
VQLQHWAVVKGDGSLYDLARYYSLAGAVESAFYWLQRAALEEGVDAAHAGEDPDLIPLRMDSRWLAFSGFLTECNTYSAAGGPQDIVLILPKGYSKGPGIPVVVGLHDRGGNPKAFIGPAYQALADRLGVAFVGVSGALPRGKRSFAWSPDPAKNAARIDAALQGVADRLTVQPGRIVALGFAQGGQAAAEVAVRYPEKYAGAVVLSPGGLDQPRPEAFQARPGTEKQGYIVACGAKEHPDTVALTDEYALFLRRTGARVRQKAYEGVSEHALPPDYWEALPQWLGFILGSERF